MGDFSVGNFLTWVVAAVLSLPLTLALAVVIAAGAVIVFGALAALSVACIPIWAIRMSVSLADTATED